MREIKFRGKTEDGEWVKGSYVYAHKWFGSGKAGHFITRIYGDRRVLVDENTVGQFTGLCDKNGVEIYDGDIVEVSNFNFRTEIGKVEWNNEIACFRIVGHLFDHSMGIHTEDIEVIGNIYDNPELLEVEE